MFRKLVRFKGWFVTLAFVLLFGLTAGPLGSGKEENVEASQPKVKNIIFMIGDGMGNQVMSAHRYMKDDLSTKKVEATAFDAHLVGMQTTYADDPDQNITDSASAATAMATGIKTYNAAISVDINGNEVKTVLEEAKSRGKATGLVATSELTHASPAAFGAHDESRSNMPQIANDYYDELIHGKHKIDVLLGGGRAYFEREDRNLLTEFQEDGYSLVTDKREMLKNKDKQVIGLFADEGLPKMIDRTSAIPSLKEMTESALKRLNSNKNGFFLMIEGSQIDWGAHDNDIVATMSEMEDFEQAFQTVIDFAKKDKETLVVMTADHSTGGFTMGANGQYNWFAEPVQNAERTPDYMAEEIANGAGVEETLNEFSGLDLTEDEINSVSQAAQPVDGVIDAEVVDNAIEEIYNARSNSGWTTSGHTGEDVGVYAYGPMHTRFAGLIDNTDHAKSIFDILRKKK